MNDDDGFEGMGCTGALIAGLFFAMLGVIIVAAIIIAFGQ